VCAVACAAVWRVHVQLAGWAAAQPPCTRPRALPHTVARPTCPAHSTLASTFPMPPSTVRRLTRSPSWAASRQAPRSTDVGG
jgi:hypothetical protein